MSDAWCPPLFPPELYQAVVTVDYHWQRWYLMTLLLISLDSKHSCHPPAPFFGPSWLVLCVLKMNKKKSNQYAIIKKRKKIRANWEIPSTSIRILKGVWSSQRAKTFQWSKSNYPSFIQHYSAKQERLILTFLICVSQYSQSFLRIQFRVISPISQFCCLWFSYSMIIFFSLEYPSYFKYNETC